jgi:signal transduction histidine kinase
VTLQRKLLLGFSFMVLPALLVGIQAIRSNALERGTLAALGQRLARSRTYAEVENAMFNQTQVVWRYLGGDRRAKQEFPLTEQVVGYWLDRWTEGLPPDEKGLADGVRNIESQIRGVADRVFALYDAGRREEASLTARRELVERLQPTLAEVNREIYRQAREFSVQRAFAQVQGIVEAERRVLWSIIVLALIAGLVASWLISRSLVRPIGELRQAMAIVGAGDLDHTVQPRSHDEIGDLARVFARMTENLRQSRARLVQSEKLASIGQMAAAVAHGMRNPLASLRAAAQVAARRVESPAAREHLDAIVEQVDRLDLRIAHLLAFSRPAPFHPLRETVRALVDGALAGVSELLRERRVELAVNLPADLPEIRVDPMRLEQALTEIVSNALAAMPPPQGGRLEIAGRAAGGVAGADGVAIEITDSGGGIPAEILATVCEPFFTTRPDGTGLGLAIAQRYVEEAGGRLEIASTLGSGTTVRIWLPVAGAAPPVAPPPAAESAAALPSAPAPRPA